MKFYKNLSSLIHSTCVYVQTGRHLRILQKYLTKKVLSFCFVIFSNKTSKLSLTKS